MSEIMIGVGAVIRDKVGRVLLVKHVPQRGGFWQGKWICPGGGLQVGETIEHGILREVGEETSLKVKLLRPLVPFERIVKEGDEVTLHVIYIDYLAEMIGGNLTPADDVGEAIWVSEEELQQRWNELHDDTKILFQIAGIVQAGKTGGC